MSASHTDYTLFTDSSSSSQSRKPSQSTQATELAQNKETEQKNKAQSSGAESSTKRLIEKLEEGLTCPLSGEIFYDPVILPTSGHAVERDFAKRLERDPWTRKPFKYSDSLTTDFTVKSLVDDFLSANPNAEARQYGYQARKIEKEKEKEKKVASSVIAIDRQNYIQNNIVPPNIPVEEHIVNIDNEPVLSTQTLLTMMQHFSEQLDKEIQEKYGCRKSDLILLFTNLFFLTGLGVSAGFLGVTDQHRRSIANSFYTTPSFDGSSRHCDAWFNSEGYTCKSIDAWQTPRTPVCDTLCDLLEPTFYTIIGEGFSVAICALGLLISRCMSVNLKLTCNRNNENLTELSIPLRSDANRLFSYLNTHNHCDLSLQSTVSEIKRALNEVESRLRMG